MTNRSSNTFNLLVFSVTWILMTGHARIDPAATIKPRSDNSNLKSSPCGGVAPTTGDGVPVFEPGATVTFEWEETINHPGWYRIAFSPDGATGFDDNVLLDNITDTQNGSVTYNDPSTYHKYSVEITLPETPCENCALQLIQVMTDRNPPTNYYSCADIKIRAADSDSDPDPEPAPPSKPTGLQIKVLRGTN